MYTHFVIWIACESAPTCWEDGSSWRESTLKILTNS